MDDTAMAGRPAQPVLRLASEDLLFLCRLHDREPDAETLAQLAAEDPRNWFNLRLDGADVETGFTLLRNHLAAVAAADLDDLAAEYAELYLTFGRRLAPNESFWIDEDRLERQQPMFDVRGWYAHHGFAAGNWRVRADDHLVNEMQFVALLLAGGGHVAATDAGRFLDRHLLRWSALFLGGVARRSTSPFFAGLALVTEAVLQQVRSLVAAATGEARRHAAPEASAEPATESPFLPGLTPGW